MAGLSAARSWVATMAAVALLTSCGGSPAPPEPERSARAPLPSRATLAGWSSLPASTFVAGSESSGHWLPSGSVPVPFPHQPVQGFSALVRQAHGDYLALSDNGYGAAGNSADFNLVVQRVKPHPSSGRTDHRGVAFTLTDPKHKAGRVLWRDGGCLRAADLPAGYRCPPRDRVLTGHDFDPESMVIDADGSFWFGNEIGPFLLHTDADGVLLEPPVADAGLSSGSTIPDSRGFEGLAISPNRSTLYPMLEGATNADIAAGRPRDRLIFTVRDGRFASGTRRYRAEEPDSSVRDFVLVNGHQGLVVECDQQEGAAARFKRVFLIDLDRTDADGYVRKTLLVDLLQVANPDHLGGFDDPFRFPFFTVEALGVVDEDTIAVMNDNNYPSGGGRSAKPDANEYAEIDLARRLSLDSAMDQTQ